MELSDAKLVLPNVSAAGGAAPRSEYRDSKPAERGQKGRVDSVHTFRLGLARTATGLPRIPHVSASPQCSQGLESRSSPTSGTADPLVRGGLCFNVCTNLVVRSL